MCRRGIHRGGTHSCLTAGSADGAGGRSSAGVIGQAQLTLNAVSSMTNEVCSELFSVPVNFSVIV